jgi:hypothetical protein
MEAEGGMARHRQLPVGLSEEALDALDADVATPDQWACGGCRLRPEGPVALRVGAHRAGVAGASRRGPFWQQVLTEL